LAGNDQLVDPILAAAIGTDAQQFADSVKLLTKQLSQQQQRAFALAWVQGGGDAARLLQMCRDGWLSAAALADANVRQAVEAGLTAEQRTQLSGLTSQVDAAAANSEMLVRLQQTIQAREADIENGQRVFKKHCAACHQLRGQGTVVGPQLDGAITRSVDRLLEDIVTPDQNVDKAFRTTSFLLEDGRVLVGLVRSESEREIRLVDATGKEVMVDPEAVERRRDAGRSLMPSNFGEVMTAAEVSDLLKFIRQ
jgi:putative heme-binding domain-containing protein